MRRVSLPYLGYLLILSHYCPALSSWLQCRCLGPESDLPPSASHTAHSPECVLVSADVSCKIQKISNFEVNDENYLCVRLLTATTKLLTGGELSV